MKSVYGWARWDASSASAHTTRTPIAHCLARWAAETVTLIEDLPPGAYEITVSGSRLSPVTADIIVWG
ncbi:MAG TPA: hypothetical protein VFC19_18140 [Candidatus Limnocylindrales bacterium]|nr:hypothetical protein [Candidatus Limnocylindrales bacterium]